jgi:DNA-binding SARP family transcriptional activator
LLTIDVLGPTKVTLDGEPRTFDGVHGRALLHRLLIAESQPVGIGELMESVWGRPATPQALRTLVSRCRSALGMSSATITVGAGGYRLDRLQFTADVDQFDALAAAALDSQAAPGSDARSAIALWRGRPFDENADASWATPTVRRLELTRLDLLARIATEAATTRNWSEVERIGCEIGREDPYDERAALMVSTAVAASGRRVEALRLIAQFREQLREELGLDPGPELAALELRLLRAEPAIDEGSADFPIPSRPGSTYVGRRMAEMKLTGRTELMEQISLLLGQHEAESSAANVLLIGEPGVGKSRLVFEQLLRMEAAGQWTAFGRWTEEPTGAFSVIRAVVLQLGGVWSLTLAASESTADHRFDIAVSIADQWQDAIGTERWLVVLDDMQWADEDSLVVLRSLFALVSDLPVSFLCVTRSVSPGSAKHTVLEDCLRQGWLVEIEVFPLSSIDAQAVIAATAPDLPFDVVQQIADVADGNPFALTEMGRHASVNPPMTPGAALSMPRSITSMCAATLGPLPDSSIGVLELASLIGSEFERSVLEEVAIGQGIEQSQAIRALDSAVRLGIVVDCGDGERFAFRHDLLRQHLSSLSSSAVTQLRHGSIARVLADHKSLCTRHERVAHHFALAGPSSAGRTVKHLLTAARDALVAGSYAQAEAFAIQAQDIVGDLRSESSLQAAVIQGCAGLAGGNVPRAQSVLMQTATLAGEEGLSDIVVDAATKVGGPWLPERADPALCALLLSAVPLAREVETAWVLRLIWARHQWNEPIAIDEARRIASVAMSDERWARSPRVRIAALATSIAVHRGAGTDPLRLEWSEELRARIGEDPHHGLATFAAVHRLLVAAQQNDETGVDWGLARVAQLASTTQRPSVAWSATYIKAAVEISRGKFIDGARTSRAARDIGRVTGLNDVEVAYALQSMERRRRTGQLAELASKLRSVVDVPADPLWDAYAALSLAEAGDELSMVIVDRLVDRAPAAHDYVRHSTLTIAFAAARCAGHDEATALFAACLEPYGATTPVTADLTTILQGEYSRD